MSTLHWCLVLAASLHFVSKLPLAVAMSREGSGYDNHNPRDQQARVTGWGRRAKAVHENQIESFPLFAAGVLVALSTPASSTAETLGLAYLAARLVYMVLYLKDVATLRSLVWSVGFFASIALMLSPMWNR